jgi:hypothetical protein
MLRACPDEVRLRNRRRSSVLSRLPQLSHLRRLDIEIWHIKAARRLVMSRMATGLVKAHRQKRMVRKNEALNLSRTKAYRDIKLQATPDNMGIRIFRCNMGCEMNMRIRVDHIKQLHRKHHHNSNTSNNLNSSLLPRSSSNPLPRLDIRSNIRIAL